MTISGKPAYVYSAWNRKTVLRHFRWMKEYGLDGVLFQRFVGRAVERRSSGDVVLNSVMAGALESGRTFASSTTFQAEIRRHLHRPCATIGRTW